MQKKFSPEVKKIISISRDEALKTGHDHIATEHLLLGVLQDSDSITSRIFSNLNISTEDVRAYVELSIIKPGGPFEVKDKSLPLDNNYRSQLGAIGSNLTATGELLLYGCNIAQGEQGRHFIDRLAQFTGADVAASDDLTGSASLGGNWQLETQVGQIEPLTLSLVAYDNSYEHLLVDDYAASTSTTGIVSVGVSKSGNIETAGDTDWFKVTLTAGQTYQFDVKGLDTEDGTLLDPVMRFRGGTGASLAFDDNSGTSLMLPLTYNSQIVYAVNTSGE